MRNDIVLRLVEKLSESQLLENKQTYLLVVSPLAGNRWFFNSIKRISDDMMLEHKKRRVVNKVENVLVGRAGKQMKLSRDILRNRSKLRQEVGKRVKVAEIVNAAVSKFLGEKQLQKLKKDTANHLIWRLQ